MVKSMRCWARVVLGISLGNHYPLPGRLGLVKGAERNEAECDDSTFN